MISRASDYMARVAAALMIVLAIVATSSAQYQITSDSIYKHISVLAHDSLEGRQVGEPGEWKAAQYIIGVFRRAGLEPKGSDGYLQPFDFVKSIDFGDENRLVVNGVELKLDEEYVPMQQSASTSFEFDQLVDVGYGIVAEEEELDHDDYSGLDVSGKAVIIRRHTPPVDDSLRQDSSAPNLDRYQYFSVKINTAIKHGAAGVFFITPEDMDDDLREGMPGRVSAKDIPIVFLSREGMNRMGLDPAAPEIRSAEGQTDLVKTIDTAYNVVGYVPGGTDTTVILGAHYDHLGWGAVNSLYTGLPAIHNGADDNGSGTGALLELARRFASSPEASRYSLLFIAFTGEEAGILGSSHFANNMTIDSSKVRMMLNMDMIGRLKEQEGLILFGTGTANEFKDYFDSLKYDKFEIISKEAGIGASDHTPFYNMHIPVLFFFTGAHEDYHKPSDDIEKIDLDGIVNVTGLVTDIVQHFDRSGGELTWRRTKSPGRPGGERYKVTLGLVPDFAADVKGLKASAISPDKPGERAGMLAGDVIIKMGPSMVGDIYEYMDALGRYRKGDSTDVIVVRGADTLTLHVLFD